LKKYPLFSYNCAPDQKISPAAQIKLFCNVQVFLKLKTVSLALQEKSRKCYFPIRKSEESYQTFRKNQPQYRSFICIGPISSIICTQLEQKNRKRTQLLIGAWFSERLQRWSNKPDVVGSIPVTTEFFLISCDSNQVPKSFRTHYKIRKMVL